jgi:FeS assembly SUF system protein
MEPNDIKEKIIEILRTIYDPEIAVNIYDLGLIYNIMVDDTNSVAIDMTLTSPGCPVGPLLLKQVKRSVKKITGVNAVEVYLVFDPPWDPGNLSEEVRLELGVF